MVTPSLNKRIALLTPAVTQDAMGGVGAPVAGPSMWAAIDSMAGQNLYQGQYVSDSTHKITIRYHPGVTPSMKVQFGTRIFNILYIGNPQEENVWLYLFAQEVL